MNQRQNIIIAGSSGLVGSHLLQQLLKNQQINKVISLSRSACKKTDDMQYQNQLIEVIDPHLQIDEKLISSIKVNVGFIALGSTKKKAGSQQALRKIDVLLVVEVAKAMKKAGVTSIYIVSCIGASPKALSHYLKCKGEMETEVEKVGFEYIVFVQPGPLAGQRKQTRTDEQFLQGIMRIINPVMKGWLLNYKPIEAELVAKSMLHFALQNPIDLSATITRVTSKTMFSLQPSL
jgi:uncharacterized protein YbjT (DUF2867 family)